MANRKSPETVAQAKRNSLIQALETINETLGGKINLEIVDPKDLRLLEENARFMNQFQYQGLLRNIKNDGFLSSVPLCHVEKDGSLLVLSGNHRVQAALDAGLKTVLILKRSDLSKAQKLSEQIAHNALVGQDDMQILKSLWDQIQDLPDKIRTGLDSALIEELDKIDYKALANAQIRFESISLLFLPSEIQRFEILLENATFNQSADKHYLCMLEDYGKVFEHLVDIKKNFNITNTAVAFAQLMEWAEMGKALQERMQMETELDEELL